MYFLSPIKTSQLKFLFIHSVYARNLNHKLCSSYSFWDPSVHTDTSDQEYIYFIGSDQEYIYFMGSDILPSTSSYQEYIYFMGSGTLLRTYILYGVGNVSSILYGVGNASFPYFMRSETLPSVLYGVENASFCPQDVRRNRFRPHYGVGNASFCLASDPDQEYILSDPDQEYIYLTGRKRFLLHVT